MSKYGRIKDGKVVEIYNSKPMWFTDDKKLLNEEQLKDVGVYPINMRELTSFDSRKEIIQYRSKQDLLIDNENKIIYNYIYKVSKSFEQIHNEKMREVNGIRDGLIYKDFPYRFPDTTYKTEKDTSYIQMRDEIDIRNIQGNGVDALRNIAIGNTTETHYFRDRDDVTHVMTPQQMLDMATAVKNKMQDVYAASWTHKYNLEQISLDQLSSEEEKIEQEVSYDINADWPVYKEESPEEDIGAEIE